MPPALFCLIVGHESNNNIIIASTVFSSLFTEALDLLFTFF